MGAIARTIRSFEILLGGMLAVGHLALLWVLYQDLAGLRQTGQTFFASLLLSQGILLIAWTLLGPARWFVRLPLAAAIASLPIWFDNWLAWPEYNTLAELALCMMGIVAFPLLLLRCRGLRVAHSGLLEVKPARVQFSILSILLLTTAAAVFLWGFLQVRSRTVDTFELSAVLAYGYLGTALAASSLFAMWAVLRPGRCWWRVLLIAAFAPLAGYLASFGLWRQSDALEIAKLTFGTTACLLISLLVIRLAGFRWYRPAPKSAMNSAASVKRPAVDPLEPERTIALPQASETKSAVALPS